MRTAVLFSLFFLFLTPAQRVSAVKDAEVNLREACRRAVAGYYLKIYDKKEHSEQYLHLLGEKEKEIAAALKQAEVNFEAKKKKFTQNEFDSKVLTEFNEATVHLDNLKKAHADNQNLQYDAKETLFVVTKQEKEAREKIAPVFKIERLEDKPQQGYPFRVEYIAPCPKYRYLCALPLDHAKSLKTLLGEETPDACLKYSNFTRR